MVRIVHCSSSCCTMLFLFVPSMRPAMTVRSMVGLIDEMTTGRACASIVALPQWNFGSNVASHGYPSRIFSFPMSVM